MGGKLHFHAPIGSLVSIAIGIIYRIHIITSSKNAFICKLCLCNDILRKREGEGGSEEKCIPPPLSYESKITLS